MTTVPFQIPVENVIRTKHGMANAIKGNKTTKFAICVYDTDKQKPDIRVLNIRTGCSYGFAVILKILSIELVGLWKSQLSLNLSIFEFVRVFSLLYGIDKCTHSHRNQI